MTNRYKYPRTPHLPFSLGIASDDVITYNTTQFNNKDVVVTLKLDGECSSLYKDYYHARSIDSKHHESRNWLKRFHSTWNWKMDEGERICGENLYARHSIAYNDLTTYFYAFSHWYEDECSDWDYTLMRFEELGLQPVQTLYRGVWDEKLIRSLWSPMNGNNEMEGFVVRTVEGFNIKDFRSHVAKFVREYHVQTDTHWMHSEVVPNKLVE